MAPEMVHKASSFFDKSKTWSAALALLFATACNSSIRTYPNQTSSASTSSESEENALKPNAPLNPVGSSGNGQVVVTFTPPPPSEGPVPTSYTVVASPGGANATGFSSPITVNGLTNGTAYFFSVTAVNAYGKSMPAMTVTSTTPATVPDAPASVTATAGDGQATVSFGVPTSNGGSAITGYTVTSNPGSITASGTNSPIIVSGLTNGTTYSFTVTASNIKGIGAQSSVSNSVVPVADPPSTEPKYLFALDYSGNKVKGYSINPSTGWPSAVGSALSTGNGPTWSAADPTGRFLYVLNLMSPSLSIFRLNPGTGILSKVGTDIGFFSSLPAGLSVDPLGRFVYVQFADGTIQQYSMDPLTGSLTQGQSIIISGASAVTIDPTGRFMYVASSTPPTNWITLYNINQTTGFLTVNASSLSNSGVTSRLVADPSGRFLYSANQNGMVSGYSFGSSNGSLSSTGTYSCLSSSGQSAMVIDPTGRFLYTAYVGSKSLCTFQIDSSTGALTLFTSTTFGMTPKTLVFESSGRYLYVGYDDGTINYFQINQNTGAPSGAGGLASSMNLSQFTAVGGATRFVYVTNSNSNSISTYSVNPSTGALTNAGFTTATNGFPFSTAISAMGRFAYVANYGSNSISQYSIQPATGQLASIAAAIATGSNPRSIALTNDQRFLYAANYGSNSISMYKVNPSTGALSSIDVDYIAGSSPAAIAVDAGGRFAWVANYGANTIWGYAINPTTGKLSTLYTLAGSGLSGPVDIKVHPNGRFLYVANSGANSISVFAIDSVSGGLSVVGASYGTTGNQPWGLGIDPTGRFIYSANKSGNSVGAYGIDTTTGQILGAIGNWSVNAPRSVHVDRSGRFLYVSNGGNNAVGMYSIDNSTGALSAIDTSEIAAESLPTSIGSMW